LTKNTLDGDIHSMQLIAYHERCSGCSTCRLACAIENFHEVNPSRSLLRIEARFPGPGDYRIHLCDQCGVCADNCPEDAIGLKDGVAFISWIRIPARDV